jgi:hypothetical protein
MNTINILLIGSTGYGKTTFVNFLLGEKNMILAVFIHVLKLAKSNK